MKFQLHFVTLTFGNSPWSGSAHMVCSTLTWNVNLVAAYEILVF